MKNRLEREPRPEPVNKRPADVGTGALVTRATNKAKDTAPAALAEKQVDSYLRCLCRLTFEFGKPLSEAEARSAVPLPPSGMGLDQFLRACQRLRYRARRESRISRHLRDLPAPFLLVGKSGTPARLALGHRDGGLVLFDGGTGEVMHLPYATALGVAKEAILLRPSAESPTAAAETEIKGKWQALAGKRVRGVLRELLVASFVINLIALVAPLFSMTLYNKIIGQAALDTLSVLVMGMVVVYGFEAVLRIIRGYVAAHTGARLDSLIGSEVMHRFLRLPYRHFETTSTGTMTERIRQLDTIRAFFTGQMPAVIVDLFFTFLALAILFFISPVLSLLVVICAPIMVGATALMHHRQKTLIGRTFAAQSAKASAIAETVNNALTIKSLALEPDMERRWESRLAESAWTSFRVGNLSNIAGTIGMTLQNLMSLAILAYGATLVIAGEMSMGALIAGNMLALRVLTPLRLVASAWQQLQETKAAFRRIDDIMDLAPETQPGEASPAPDFAGSITFEKVNFSFAPDAQPVLNDVELTIEKGTVLGVIGPSGSGKSTLAKLMQGLYKPSSGRVLIDGTDVQHLSLPALRGQIGVVPQDRQIFAGTVRENILIGSGHRDPERAVAVAKFVGAHEFIQRMPKGYETPIGEAGMGLSNGQKQLICIARALIRNPRILVMDEPTSDLDPVSEDFFLRNLQRASRGRTVIMITHRIAPLAIADRVALLIDGRIERVGPPNEVVAFAKTRMAEVAMGR